MRIVVERLLLPSAPHTTLDSFDAHESTTVWMKIGDSGVLTIHSGIRGTSEMTIKAYSPGYWINAKVE